MAIKEPGKPEVAANPDAPPVPARKLGDPMIERARAAAYEFDDTLPNFICDQFVLRFHGEGKNPSWKLQDRVEVELMYVSGREDYRNIRHNGKPLKKGSPEDSGTWSSGEFGSTLADIFADSTNAQFRYRGEGRISGVIAKIYDFSVEQQNAHWQIGFGRKVFPSYKGSLWIDPSSARVLRIEMNTRTLPADYEVDMVESTVDYGWVTISGQKFLVPVKSENLGCFRGTMRCVHNEIDFRNYRKFGAESQVLQVESDISFPEADEPKKTPDAKKPADPKKKQ